MLTASSVLDGFTITAGNADGAFPLDSGGGMYLTSSSPTLTNLTFSANSAINGGGMFNQGSRPTLTNVTFRANNAKFGEGYTTSVAATQTCATVSCGATRP